MSHCARALCEGCHRMIHEVEFSPRDGKWLCQGCWYGLRFRETAK